MIFSAAVGMHAKLSCRVKMQSLNERHVLHFYVVKSFCWFIGTKINSGDEIFRLMFLPKIYIHSGQKFNGKSIKQFFLSRCRFWPFWQKNNFSNSLCNGLFAATFYDRLPSFFFAFSKVTAGLILWAIKLNIQWLENKVQKNLQLHGIPSTRTLQYSQLYFLYWFAMSHMTLN